MQLNPKHAFYVLAVSILFSACKSVDYMLKKTSKYGIPKSFFVKNSHHWNLDGNHAVDITYLGTGGIYIHTPNSNLLVDPFFSNPSLPAVFRFKPLKIDTDRINLFLDRTKLNAQNNIDHILITHSHYDHLMDVPYIYHNYLKNKTYTTVIGSHATKKVLNGCSYPVNSMAVVGIDANTLNPLNISTTKWVKIYPVETDHAPHFYCVSLFKGIPKIKEQYNPNDVPDKASQWKSCHTLGYLLHITDSISKDVLKIYIHTSSADSGYGLLPESLVNDGIDIAILAAASFKYVNNYPESLINHLNPKRVIVCHWENFFKKYNINSVPPVVQLTNLNKFLKRLNVVHPCVIGPDTMRFIVPKPLAKVEIR